MVINSRNIERPWVSRLLDINKNTTRNSNGRDLQIATSTGPSEGTLRAFKPMRFVKVPALRHESTHVAPRSGSRAPVELWVLGGGQASVRDLSTRLTLIATQIVVPGRSVPNLQAKLGGRVWPLRLHAC